MIRETCIRVISQLGTGIQNRTTFYNRTKYLSKNNEQHVVIRGRHGGAAASAVASQGCGFFLGPFCVEYACSSCVCHALQFPRCKLGELVTWTGPAFALWQLGNRLPDTDCQISSDRKMFYANSLLLQCFVFFPLAASAQWIYVCCIHTPYICKK